MHPHRADRRHEDHFDPSAPHLDFRDFARGGAEQRRFGMLGFEVPHDRDAFGDHRAVIELEDRRLPARVLGDEVLRLLLALGDRDFLAGKLNALLGGEDTHAARIGRRVGTVVE